jgi:hypothetical protein
MGEVTGYGMSTKGEGEVLKSLSLPKGVGLIHRVNICLALEAGEERELPPRVRDCEAGHPKSGDASPSPEPDHDHAKLH